MKNLTGRHANNKPEFQDFNRLHLRRQTIIVELDLAELEKRVVAQLCDKQRIIDAIRDDSNGDFKRHYTRPKKLLTSYITNTLKRLKDML